MNSVNSYYFEACKTPSDINEHLPYLRSLATDCKSVIEFGVRKIVSTWAFVSGLSVAGGKLTSVDIRHPSEYGESRRFSDLERLCGESGVSFSFKKESSLSLEPEVYDMVFIDTVHNYEFLSKELARHGVLATKYIAMHDTELCRNSGHDGGGGMWKAIEEFIEANPDWCVLTHATNNNGLTVLTKRS